MLCLNTKLWVGTLFCLLWTVGHAQNVSNVNGTIYLSGNALMTVNQSFTNSGRVVNNGELIVRANWTNVSVYEEEATGTFRLDGSSSQFVSHNGQTMYRVTMSESEKRITTDLVVLDELEFTDEKIIVDDETSIIIEEDGSVDGGSDQSYIVGRLYQVEGNERFYPIGTIGRYLPVRITDIADPSIVIGFRSESGNVSEVFDKTIRGIGAAYHWEASALENELPNFRISLDFVNADFLEDLSRAVVAEADSIGTPYKNLGGQNLSGDLQEGSVTSALPGNGPYFSLASTFIDGDNPRLNILNLVTPNGDGNHDYFEIQNIEAYSNNRVRIFDRLGRTVFEKSGYDNDQVRFDGISLQERELPSGTYYFTILSQNEEIANGFLELIR